MDQATVIRQEFVMSISSVSLTFFSMVSPPAATRPVASAPAAANEPVAPSHSCCESHGHSRRNVLYDAMLSALRDLGLTQRPAQPAQPPSAGGAPAALPRTSIPATDAASTPAPTLAAGTPGADAGSAVNPAPASVPPQSIEDAVLSFANALMQALRGADDGSSRRGRGRDDDGEGRRHHHGHGHGREHRGGMERSYSGLASRIEALAVRFDVPAPAVQAVPPAATPVAQTNPVIVPAPIKLPGTEPVRPDAADAVAATEVATPTVLPATASKNSLAEAFAAMLKALRGGDVAPSTPATPASADNSLAMFLHSLARALAPDHSMQTTTAVGVMINITA
jgi:hypothetical protein